jgi:hypothetical protein
MTYKEGRWIFRQSGPAAPFERCDRYALPKVRARLDAELLKDYGRSLGIPFWDANAYGTKAVLLNWNTKPVMSTSQAEGLLRRLWDQVRGR